MRGEGKGILTVSINRYICIYWYYHRASSECGKAAGLSSGVAVDRDAGTKVAVTLAAGTTGQDILRVARCVYASHKLLPGGHPLDP